MDQEFLGDRRKALEESFFSKENEKLRQALRQKEAIKQKEHALSDISGIEDETVLRHLVSLNIGADTLAALTMVPLVQVAWADGDVDAKERAAILEAAEEVGVGKGSPSADLLNEWLKFKPDREILKAWKEYVQALSSTLSPEESRRLRSALLTLGRSVAEASGGVLGFGGKISKAEREVMDEFEG
jgi:hypothetical protein